MPGKRGVPPPVAASDRRPVTMDDSKLERMTVKELRELRGRVEQAMRIVELREKSELIAKMSAMAAEHGLTLADVLGDKEPHKR